MSDERFARAWTTYEETGDLDALEPWLQPEFVTVHGRRVWKPGAYRMLLDLWRQEDEAALRLQERMNA
ncbi:MAG: hypothetical protein R3324_07735 [Halobacteriales archaeon]|nr:hypothetical protein [Halobacteriales archaeon]